MIGTLWCSTVHTRRPFGSVCRTIDGKHEPRIGADVGQPRSIDCASRHRYRGGALEGERVLAARNHAEDDAPVERRYAARAA